MFLYDHLSRNESEIRLVRFHHHASSKLNLSLELRHASMSETNYSALSYVWGDVSDTVDISINGSSLKIGRNLHAGLEQLRENGVRDWLWIDSICIQQSDLDEKSYQVGLMGSIFSNADRVYSWLGLGADGSDAAMDFISRIGPRAMKFEGFDLLPRDERLIAYLNNPTSYKESTGNDDDFLGYASLAHDILHEPDLRGKDYGDEGLADGIQALMERDYWHRIWINQEVALAKEVVIVCGTRTTPLSIFEATLSILDDCYARYRYHNPATRDFGRGLHSNFAYNLAMETRSQRLRGDDIQLDILLFHHNMDPPDRPFYSATDPRDIVFGLLGVTTDNDRLGIQIDYRASMAEVFTATTRAFIENDGRYWGAYKLDSCVPKEQADDGLPSWVPDWREMGKSGNSEDSINMQRHFDATRGIPVPPPTRTSTDDSLGILRRYGCRVDIITEVMQPHKETGGHAALHLANSDSRLKSICDFMNLGTQIGPGEDYIWRVLLAPHWYRRINASMSKDIATLIRKIMRRSPIDVGELTSEQTNFIRDLRDFWNKPPEVDDVSAQLADARKRLQHHERFFNYHRTLFKTHKSMLGLGYRMVLPGDVVTLLWGVKSPIILRPRNGGGFTYVGDAYVDGIMHGEFLENQPVEEEFEIY